MNIRVGNEEYKIEFTFEASLYKDCIEKVFKLFGGIADESIENANAENAISHIAELPRTVITLLYAGLLEHNPVADENEAKKLLKQFFKENTDSDISTFFGMMTALMSQMEEDGFFKQIGLIQEEKNQPKIPQDRKKKTTTIKALEK